MTSPEEYGQKERVEKIAHRIKSTPDRQLANFIDLAIEVINDGSFPPSSIAKVIRVVEILKRFKQGHAVPR